MAVERTIRYSGKEVTILWKPHLCTHSTRCWKGLPAVFKPGQRPWILPDGAEGQRLGQAAEGQVVAAGLLGLGGLEPADGLVGRDGPEAGVAAAGDLGAEPEPDQGADQLVRPGPGQAGLGGDLADLERPLGQHADIAAGLPLAQAMADEPVDQIRVTRLGQRSVLP